MKKISKSKLEDRINKKSLKIIKNLNNIDEFIIGDIFTSLYNDNNAANEFKSFMPAELSVIDQKIYILTQILKLSNEGLKMFNKVVKDNNEYLKASDYLKFSNEQLREEFENGMCPSLHSTSVTPEMIILYNYSKNLFSGEKNKFLIEEYRRITEGDQEQYTKLDIVKLQNNLQGSDIEVELNEMVYEKNIVNGKFDDEEVNQEIAEAFTCEYNSDKKFDNVPRGLMHFLYFKLEQFYTSMSLYDNSLGLLKKQLTLVEKSIYSHSKDLKNISLYKSEIDKLQKKNDTLMRENMSLKSINSNKDDYKEVEKENYYLKTRVEALEEKIALLEEEKEINLSIEDDIKIDSKIISFEKPELVLPAFKNIIIFGGKWNSKTKEELSDALSDNLIEFIPAEKTLRSFDKIKNADIVIFDTCHNSHKYYYKIKEESNRLLHINQSNVDEVLKLFSEVK